jgi:hypothetical protein
MSSISPPGPQLPLNYAQPPRNDLRRIAVRQRALMICLLVYIVLVILRFVLPPIGILVIAIPLLGVIVTAAVFVFMLAMAVYSTGPGVVLGILTLIPLIGLIPLLIVNGKATNILRAHKIKVGLMGANPNDVPPGV